MYAALGGDEFKENQSTISDIDGIPFMGFMWKITHLQFNSKWNLPFMNRISIYKQMVYMDSA